MQETRAYADLVNANLRDETNEQEDKELVEDLARWRALLIKIKLSIEVQMSRFKSDSAINGLTMSDEEYDDWLIERMQWRANSLKLKGAVENRLTEIKYLKSTIEDHDQEDQ